MEFKDLPEDIQRAAGHTLQTALRDALLDDDSAQAKRLARNISAAFVELFSEDTNAAKLDGEKTAENIAKCIAHTIIGARDFEAPQKKAWGVKVLDGNGVVVWSWNAADKIDTSGDVWRNGNHCTMAAVHYSLLHAMDQATELPKENDWLYPFSIFSGSKGTMHQCGQRIALEGLCKAPRELSQNHHLHCKNNNSSSCD
jgi:hypothetical protein